jgi:WD40 repeat protein
MRPSSGSSAVGLYRCAACAPAGEECIRQMSQEPDLRSADVATQRAQQRLALDAFAQALGREAYILATRPDLTWQQLYNAAQWKLQPPPTLVQTEFEKRNAPGSQPWLHLRTPLSLSSALLYILRGHSQPVNACAIDPFGARFVTASDDATLKLWDLSAGRELLTLQSAGRSVTACAISPDGNVIVSGNQSGELELWDAATGVKVNHPALSWGHHDPITTCVFSPDGGMILSADTTEGVVCAWHRRGGEFYPAKDLNQHLRAVNALAFRPDGARVASGSDDGDVRIWDPHTTEQFLRIETRDDSHFWSSVTDCAFSPDGTLLASASSDYTVKLWHAETGELVVTFQGHTEPVTACRFSPNGTQLVSASKDGMLMIWDVHSHERLATLVGHGGEVTDCCISPDGTRLVSTGGAFDRSVRIWDLREAVASSVVTSNERQLGQAAAEPPDNRVERDHVVVEWRREWDEGNTVSEQHEFVGSNFGSRTGPTHAMIVTAAGRRGWESVRVDADEIRASLLQSEAERHDCAVSPDASYAIAWARSDRIALWDARKRKKRATLNSGIDRITAGVISADGRHVVFGGEQYHPYEGRIVWWNTSTYQKTVIARAHAGRIPGCGISPDGRYVISIGEDGYLKVWKLHGGDELL